jgi:hypothetical protein
MRDWETAMAPSPTPPLSAEQLERFDRDVAKAGLDPEVVRACGEQSRRVIAASLAELRELIGPSSEAMRAGSVVNTKFGTDNGDPDQALLDGVHRYVFGDGELTPHEISSIENAVFPLAVDVAAAEDKRIPAGETWTIDDGRPQKHIFGMLIMESGAKIDVFGTVLTLECQRLVREG